MVSHSGATVASILLPVIVFGLVIYSWYIYVFRVCCNLLLEPPVHVAQAVIFIVIACVFWLLTLVSYLRILFSYPGKAVHGSPSLTENARPSMVGGSHPRYYYSPQTFDTETMTTRPVIDNPAPNETTSLLPTVSVCRSTGMPRYCETCKCYKPDRTHHCRECNACILKMDHHCPWISGCVGFRNYKFFFLFVLYAAAYAMWLFCSALALVLDAVLNREMDVDPQWIVLLVLSFVFGMTLCGFTGVHLYYMLFNITTIEHISRRPLDIRVDFDYSGNDYEVVTVTYNERLWDLGKSSNFRAIMGRRVWDWFLPITRTPGDGYVFPYNNHSYTKLVERARQQRAMLNGTYTR